MPKAICFITPGHISSNPRLMKEAVTSVEHNYNVHIIFTQALAYLSLEDEKLLEQNPKISYTIIKINFFTKLIYRILLPLSKIFFFSLQDFIYLKSHFQFLKKAKNTKADLYIAHNLGALPIAVKAANYNKAKGGFDAEDFHRNEVSNNPNDFNVKLKTYIEDKYLSRTDYFTAASPLIAQAYQNLYPNLKPVLINNVFELKHQPHLNINNNESLKLGWFSQTVGRNRGLEEVIEAINLINNPLIELHVLGNASDEIKHYLNQLAKFKINYYTPIAGNKIFEWTAQFDIGLATEENKPHNRDICLTNKIFTYLISGLAIIASNTQAQKQFMEENPGIGCLYSIGNINELKKCIEELFNNRVKLNSYKKNAYQLAQSKYNWELESKKFLNIIQNI